MTAVGERTAARRLPDSAPARLRVLGAALVLACLLTAVLSGWAGWTRTDATGGGGARLAALDYDTAELYEALNGANASAASGVGADRTSSPTMLARFDSYVISAQLRLSHAQGLVEPDGPDAAALESLSYQLPRYSAAVTTARALRGQDPARAQAQLDGAADLMRSAVLPTADALAQRRQEALAANYAGIGGLPVVVLAVGALTLVGLVVASVREARRTRRVLNPGLVAAFGLTLAALAWWSVATLLAAEHLEAAGAHDATSTELGDVRVAMLEARADETAAPAAGADAATRQELAEQFDGVLAPGGPLDTAGASPSAGPVRDAVVGWRTAIDGAGVGSDASRVGFVRLTTTVGDAINTEQGRRTAAVAASATSFTGLLVGPAALMVLAALAVAHGIRIRLREYQGAGE